MLLVMLPAWESKIQYAPAICIQISTISLQGIFTSLVYDSLAAKYNIYI